MTICPACHAAIADDDINIQKDIAYCRACRTTTPFSELEAELEVASVDPSNLPRGVTLRELGNRTEIRASTRTLGVAVFMTFFAVLWNGIVATVFGGAVFSGSGSGQAPPVLFMIPFVLVGLGVILVALMAWCGQMKVDLRRDRGTVFTGLGPVGLRKTFDPAGVERVRMVTQQQSSSNSTQQVHHLIELSGQQKLRFGWLLNEERTKAVAGLLRLAIIDARS